MMKYLRRFWPLYLLTAGIFFVLLFAGTRTVTVVAQSQPVNRQHVIVIDAGHGGEDGGATSCTGVLESKINLEIALRLNDLCHLLGFDTKMIRSTDISVYTEGTSIAAKKASDLRQRVRLVNDTENAVLISIHQNTFSDGRYSGAQVFYGDMDGSMELAQMLQQAFASADPENHRRAQKADHVYLMQHIRKPGVLIECGFLSNPDEESKLRSESYQKELCGVIVSVLSCYLNP